MTTGNKKNGSPSRGGDIEPSAKAMANAQQRRAEALAKDVQKLLAKHPERADKRADVLRALLSIDDHGEAAQAAMLALAATQTPAPRRPWNETVRAAFDVMHARADGRQRPIRTPWAGVDAKIAGGWWPGLYTLASATGAGKTQWALQSAIHVARSFVREHEEHVEECARQGLPPPEGPERVAYIALELGDVELVARMLGLMAAEAGVTAEELGARHPIKWSSLYFGKVPRALHGIADRFGAELESLPLHVETADAIGWSYMDLRALAKEYRPRFLVLDYSQLVSPPAENRREELRTTIGNVAKVARDLARKQGMTVLALSSTSRANYGAVDGASPEPDGGGGKKNAALPLGEGDAARLIGLGKESGEIEFTADVVLALARERNNDPAAERPMWLAIAKGRGFPTGWVKMRFDGSRFTEDTDAEPKGWKA
jgi:replicative DNA helicase